MDYLMVIDNATGEGVVMTRAEASTLMHVDAADIEQSIHAFGICQSLDFTIIDTEVAEDILEA